MSICAFRNRRFTSDLKIRRVKSYNARSLDYRRHREQLVWGRFGPER